MQFTWKKMLYRLNLTRNGGNYDAMPLNATQCNATAKLKSFWGFHSELQTNPMPFHLDLPLGTTLMPHAACDGLGMEQNTEGG